MYTEHFGLSEKPFSISPDPRYLYLSQRHADALAHLLYGISESGGFIQLTGEVGTGKTTLIRSVLGQLPDETDIALILNPQLSSKQFLQAICQELEVPCVQRDTARSLIERLNGELLERHAANRRVVLIVDEAQTMSPELIEQVRLLTNLETAKQKLLQIILIGQPELRELLAQPQMRQVAQRITGRYHLEPLTSTDTSIYVNHRMKVAGSRPDVFSRRAVRNLFRLSRGIPRLINVIADRALLAGYTRDQTNIDGRLVQRAAAEVFGHDARTRRWPGLAAAAIFIALLLTAIRLGESDVAEPQLALLTSTETAPPAPAPTPAPAIAGVAEPPNAAMSLPALRELLASNREPAAVDALARLWGAELSGDIAAACERIIAAHGLRCHELTTASISELKPLNHPLVVELKDSDGANYQALLRGLDGSRAQLVVNDETHTVAVELLDHFQAGQHLLIWRPAVTAADWPLQEGSQGVGVIWLRATLDSLGFESPSGTQPDLFTSELTNAVQAYQAARDIAASGEVTAQTLITLQAEIGLVEFPLRRGSY